MNPSKATVPSHPAAARSSDPTIDLMQLANGFLVARCLYVIAEAGIADSIDDAPQTTESLARATRTNADALHRIMREVASYGVFEAAQGGWAHTETSRLLRSDHPGSKRDYIRMMGMPVFWRSWEHLDHSLRTGETAFLKIYPEGVFQYLAEHPDESKIFNAAMTSKSHGDIAAILQAYDFSQFGTIADIAGGRSHLLRAILKRCPKSQGILFDQPHVCAEVSPDAGEKLSIVGGSFFTDRMPKADAYLLMNIIHDWADAECIKILSAIRRDMPQHACLLLIETIVPVSTGPHLSKELDIVMLAIPGGRERTKEEYADLASKCGLRLKRVVGTASPYSILEMDPGVSE